MKEQQPDHTDQALESDVDALKQLLAEQTRLQQLFENAKPADDYKDEIPISDELKKAITIKMDKNNFYVYHMPSGIYMACSAYTMPRALKRAIEEWVGVTTQPTDPSSA